YLLAVAMKGCREELQEAGETQQGPIERSIRARHPRRPFAPLLPANQTQFHLRISESDRNFPPRPPPRLPAHGSDRRQSSRPNWTGTRNHPILDRDGRFPRLSRLDPSR